ncbi:MAG: hypothetical protein A2788_00270 [Candidatus Abawacabacteria bacterium RIFCSPHIGHO2_01_FULL_46_8]|uniref:Purine nucleoside phosphorylase n=1 Tax=Candidatus Abawacabacteria bacterium RIFCSPHIGHO2_01_FULL_46_8 TaxID=1817815 RepID=A0A1F4XJJ4_9BACT|nr:MAG: hypothetical protein A2788_00270 [Candidatus Abawacabacteria bacterium RIFCSPHIGHO2_01_FULL_46_8]
MHKERLAEELVVVKQADLVRKHRKKLQLLDVMFKLDDLEHVKSPLLAASPNIVQASSTLQWGSMRLKDPAGRPLVASERLKAEENLAIFLQRLGIEPEQAIGMNQVHSSNIAVVNEHNLAALRRAEAPLDGLLTEEANLALLCRTADCLPVSFHDPKTGIIGLAHAGWKGVAAGILPKMVMQMERMGSSAGDILTAIGPAIGACCYEVGGAKDERVRLLSMISEEAVKDRGYKRYLDLRQAAQAQLLGMGMLKKRIEVSPICTCCQRENFPSAYGWRYVDQKAGAADSMITVMMRRVAGQDKSADSAGVLPLSFWQNIVAR